MYISDFWHKIVLILQTIQCAHQFTGRAVMMRSGKQRYYAALEHEENAGRLFSQRRREATPMNEPRGEDLLYADIGARAYKAFANILDSLGEMAARSGSARSGTGSDEAARRVLEGV